MNRFTAVGASVAAVNQLTGAAISGSAIIRGGPPIRQIKTAGYAARAKPSKAISKRLACLPNPVRESNPCFMATANAPDEPEIAFKAVVRDVVSVVGRVSVGADDLIDVVTGRKLDAGDRRARLAFG